MSESRSMSFVSSNIARLLNALMLAILLVGCQSPLHLNEIQLIGSHNSYKQPIDPDLLKAIADSNPNQALALDYAHPSITQQLELGLRKLELDVFYDPQGGLYRSPLGLALAPNASAFDGGSMLSAGFKVMHIQDIDFRSHCATLEACLQSVVNWSNSNEGHSPLFITINPKQGKIPLPGFVEPVLFDKTAFSLLDGEIRKALGAKLYEPDQFRQNEVDLPAAVARGWPTVDALAGRVVLVLDTGEALRTLYKQDHPALVGRAMFMNAQENTSESAILIVNDPVADFERIRKLVRQGYIVRTRSDADTVEARTGDYTRMNKAFDSGAQIISTDYYQVESQFETGFIVRFDDSAESGRYYRRNPLRD